MKWCKLNTTSLRWGSKIGENEDDANACQTIERLSRKAKGNLRSRNISIGDVKRDFTDSVHERIYNFYLWDTVESQILVNGSYNILLLKIMLS